MKNHTKFIACYLMALLATKTLIFFHDIQLAQTFGPNVPAVARMETLRWYRLVAVLPELVIGLWLFVVHKASFSGRVIWAVFGAVGGLLALLVYYCLRIHDQCKSREPAESEVG